MTESALARVDAASGPEWWNRIRPALGRHWLFLAVFTLGVSLRVVTQAAYRPALLYIDSYRYLDLLDDSTRRRACPWVTTSSSSTRCSGSATSPPSSPSSTCSAWQWASRSTSSSCGVGSGPGSLPSPLCRFCSTPTNCRSSRISCPRRSSRRSCSRPSWSCSGTSDRATARWSWPACCWALRSRSVSSEDLLSSLRRRSRWYAARAAGRDSGERRRLSRHFSFPSSRTRATSIPSQACSA